MNRGSHRAAAAAENQRQQLARAAEAATAMFDDGPQTTE